jgi:hypothetical protein
MVNDETPPTFEPIDVAWGQTVILQELIAQLIQSGALPVERARRVIDIALQRTIKATEQAPGATRFVKHVHDKLQLNDYYRSTLPHPAAWDQGRK